jgi:Na+/H+ antiporter NhaD/arsenite permease-like protein
MGDNAFFLVLFVHVEVWAAMVLLAMIGDALALIIEKQDEDKQLVVVICFILWVSAITSAFFYNMSYAATIILVIHVLFDSLPDTLPIETPAWVLSFGACLGGNGTLLGASANIVTVGVLRHARALRLYS